MDPGDANASKDISPLSSLHWQVLRGTHTLSLLQTEQTFGASVTFVSKTPFTI